MFLLIPRIGKLSGYPLKYLHSTMFLLIPESMSMIPPMISNLHSTMFLLILFNMYTPTSCFCYLHSTMFLLIQSVECVYQPNEINLHSTMFLLIPVPQTYSNYTFLLSHFCLPFKFAFTYFHIHTISLPFILHFPPLSTSPHFHIILGRQLQKKTRLILFFAPKFLIHPLFLSAFEYNNRI